MGFAIAAALSKLIGPLLFGVGVVDVVTLVGAPAVLLTIVVLACGLPALVAASVNPARALRGE